MTSLAPHIFRAYDIRGVVGTELDGEAANRIGRAYATYVRDRYEAREIAVGRDNRPSSDPLSAGLIAGIRAVGVSVVDIGLSPSPLLYYAAASWELAGGINVTASHSPRQYNGFKLLERNGIPLAPEEIQSVRTIAQTGRFADGQGALRFRDAKPEYLEFLTERFRLSRPLRVVVDPGNAVTALTGPEALRRIGCEVIAINAALDGSFPVHMPNPQDPETMRGLMAEVQRVGADMGCAWDADGDRLGIVDEHGRRHEPDAILAVLARDVLSRHAGTRILMDVTVSRTAIQSVRDDGGEAVLGVTGHSLMKRKMRDEGILFGGEGSAHFYFAEDYYGLDDAVFGACVMARILADSGCPLSRHFDGLQRFVTSPEFRFPCADDAKFAVAAAIATRFRDEYPVLEIDGARIDFGDGWALVRASNTGPQLTVRVEATSAERYDAIRDLVWEALLTHPEVTIPPGSGERPL